MKFCYIDETGTTPKDSLFSMAGILLDATKVRISTERSLKLIENLFSEYSAVHYKTPDEIKTNQIYEGKNKWNDISPDIRKKFIKDICELVVSSSGKVFFSVIDFSKFNSSTLEPKNTIGGYWKTSATHLLLQIQYTFFNKSAKENTVVIFDDHAGNVRSVTQILSAHRNIHDFYKTQISRTRNKTLKDEEVLNRVIETLSVESKSSVLVQVADIIAYVLRRYFELNNGTKELYDGDAAFISECFNTIKPVISSKQKKFWNTNSEFSNFCGEISPDNLLDLLK